MDSRIRQTFQLMKKAGALLSGTSASSRPIVYMWIATDASDTRKKECVTYCEKHSIPYAIEGEKAFFEDLMGYPHVAVLRLTNPHFLTLIHSLREERHNET